MAPLQDALRLGILFLTDSKKSFLRLSPVKQKAVNLALSIATTLLAVTAWVHICLYKIQRVLAINLVLLCKLF